MCRCGRHPLNGIAASLVLLPQQISWMGTDTFLNENSPDLFAEISPFLAQAKNITHGAMVRVSSASGSVRMCALVTGRFSSYNLHGREKEAMFIFLPETRLTYSYSTARLIRQVYAHVRR